MTTREALIEICSKGDTVHNTRYSAILADVVSIVEAWSKDRKNEIIQLHSGDGYKLIDHVVLKDYDLVLWKLSVKPEIYGTDYIYAVSINFGSLDPLDASAQIVHYPGSSLRHAPVKSVIAVLKDWIDEYGRLVIDSVDTSKVFLYKEILAKYFNVTQVQPGSSKLGFYIE